MITMKDLLRNRDIVYFIDNTSALHSLVKGTSRNEELDRTIQLAHLCSFELQCRLWWEYVPSNQNWADGISRLGRNDPFVKEKKITVIDLSMDVALWTEDLTDAWTLMSTITRRACRIHWQ